MNPDKVSQKLTSQKTEYDTDLSHLAGEFVSNFAIPTLLFQDRHL